MQNNITRSRKYQSGMKFNMLTLIEPTPERKNKCVVWKCKCDCGNITYVSTGNIKSTKSCGCLRHRKRIDIQPGDVFGKLTVIEEIPERDKQGRLHFKCQCECKRFSTPTASDLKAGNSTSCGKCSPFWDYKKYTDLTNKRFGKLVAINPILNKEDECYQNQTGRSMFWLCKCDCGNFKKISSNHLTLQRTTSCGCQLGSRSKGEQEIIDILNSNNIKFRTEVTFSGLKNIHLLRFDFGILDENGNIIRLIEFDGEQHYKEQNFFQPLEQIQNNDNLKNDYCKIHNIPLVRIPYYELGKITLEMLLGEEYLI